ncbi:class I SAM-dependent methyltransferase [Elongatibacter sediminis]|uniref:Methyltransferase domain-containing protein n=1 Tax=Elongatibacter sediminis TaxID=3119006 RepID=A0AAW9RIV0_9GAMM
MSEGVRINLGSGHWKLPGWVNVDLDRDSRPDVCADLSAGLPFRDRCADYMHTEDFIDQLDLEHARRFLRECHRILRPGGVIRVLTPDVEQLARMYLDDPDGLKALWRDHVGVPLRYETPAEILNVGMRFAGHTFLYDAETFAELATDCGFRAERVGFNQSGREPLRGLDLRSPDNAISLYHDCYRLD